MSSTVIVGIAGGTASGKSTLAVALGEALSHVAGIQPHVIAADRYMFRNIEQGPSFTSPSSGEVLFNANHPESVNWAQLLIDLDGVLAQPDAPNVIILEGLMVLQNEKIRERLDIRLFVELDADERALRRMIRDMTNGRGKGDLTWIATYYRECARVGHGLYVEPSRVHADLILRGDARWERIQPMLIAVIADRVASASTQPA